MSPIFSATNAGFFLRFRNGWAISVKWNSNGGIQLCSEQNSDGEYVAAEVAVINAEGEMIQISRHDTVLGWQSTDEVANLIRRASMGAAGGWNLPD